MQRLKGGNDVEDVIVTCPNMTKFSPGVIGD
jgi:hypothetical protein